VDYTATNTYPNHTFISMYMIHLTVDQRKEQSRFQHWG